MSFGTERAPTNMTKLLQILSLNLIYVCLFWLIRSTISWQIFRYDFNSCFNLMRELFHVSVYCESQSMYSFMEKLFGFLNVFFFKSYLCCSRVSFQKGFVWGYCEVKKKKVGKVYIFFLLKTNVIWFHYHIYLAIRWVFPLSRMTTNIKISPIKLCYNTCFTLPKQSLTS